MRFALFSKAKSRRCTGPSTRSVCTLLRGAAAKEIKCKVESFTVEWILPRTSTGTGGRGSQKPTEKKNLVSVCFCSSYDLVGLANGPCNFSKILNRAVVAANTTLQSLFDLDDHQQSKKLFMGCFKTSRCSSILCKISCDRHRT